MVKRQASTLARSAHAAKQAQPERYDLHLYISGMSPRSLRTIENLKEVCNLYLQGHYRLRITDINQRPELMRRDEIVAAPTLIKRSPLPLRRLVGDLSDRERVLAGLGLRV